MKKVFLLLMLVIGFISCTTEQDEPLLEQLKQELNGQKDSIDPAALQSFRNSPSENVCEPEIRGPFTVTITQDEDGNYYETWTGTQSGFVHDHEEVSWLSAQLSCAAFALFD